MAGIDLLGEVCTPKENNDSENENDLLYASGEDKTAGLASRSANKYAKVQRIDENDNGGNTLSNVQGSYNKNRKMNHATTNTEMTQIVIDKNGNEIDIINNNNNNDDNGYNDIAAAFNDSNDPSKYMGIYEKIRNEINGISKNVSRIEHLASDYESVDKTSGYKIIMDKLDKIISNNRQITISIKNSIQLSKKENDRLLSLKENQGSSLIQWRVNQLNSCIKQFKSTNMLFESSLTKFNKTMKETQRRLIGIVNTDDPLRPISTRADEQLNSQRTRKLNDDEIDELLEDPEAATQFLNKALKLQNVSDVLLDRLSELEIRHEGMLRIEQSIKELHQLWHDLNILITEQQELLDNIEENVIQTREYVESGTKHLTKAEKHQKMSRKLQCCLFCFCLVVALIIVGYFFGGF